MRYLVRFIESKKKGSLGAIEREFRSKKSAITFARKVVLRKYIARAIVFDVAPFEDEDGNLVHGGDIIYEVGVPLNKLL